MSELKPGLLVLLAAAAAVVGAIPPIKGANGTCEGGEIEKTVEKKSRVGDDVVLPCGVTEESKDALANKTVVIWTTGAGGAGEADGEDAITIPIVPSETTAAGHNFKSPDRYDRLVVNYANASLRLLNVSLGDRKDFYCKVYRGASCFYVVHVRLVVVDRPGPPVNVTVEALSKDKVRIRWRPGPDNYSPITHYEIKVSRDSTYSSTSDTRVLKADHPKTYAVVEHLQPYTKYLSRIKATNEIGFSDWTIPISRRTLEGVPDGKPVIFNTSATNSSITVEVRPVDVTEERMKGEFSGFEARLELGKDLVGEKRINTKSRHKTKIRFVSLRPFTRYSFSVCLRNGRNSGPWEKLEIKTKEGTPGPPRVFATDVVTPNTFMVRWEAPVVRNGKITSYVITVVDKKTNLKQILRTHKVSDLSLTIRNLMPYHEYLVYVAAVTKAGPGPLDGPQKVLTDVGPPGSPTLLHVRVNVTGHGVSLDWRTPKKLLKPELTSYMLCWARHADGPWFSMHAQTTKPKQSAFTYDVTPAGPGEPGEPGDAKREEARVFRATIPWNKLESVWKSSAKMVASELHFSVYGRTKGLYCTKDKVGTTVSAGKVTGRRLLRVHDGSTQPCFYTGEHSAKKVLVITVDDYNRLSAEEPEEQTRVTADSSVTVLAIVLTLILVMVAGTIGFFLLCRRCGSHRGYDLALSNGLERVNSLPRGLSGCGETLETLEPVVMPSIVPYSECGVPPVPAHDFPDTVARLHSNSEVGFSQEFDEIDKKQQLNNWPDATARLPENAQKNRYTNIFPYDHTRVRVQNTGLKRSDYINANFIDGYDRKNAYIAAQGPMPSTFEEFWQMIWEQRTNTIVMISNLIERGRLKCDQYWPSGLGQEGSQQYGRILVTLNRQVELAYYIVREMTVRNLKSKKCASKFRYLYHYQYTDWPDFAVPESPLPVLVFIRKTVSHVGKSSGAILVHCSAGVGRTGTYLCIESQIRQFEREKNFNVRGFLEHIRQQRMKLVQTEEQYAFIHDALLEHYLCSYHEIPRNELSAYVKCLKEVEPCSCVRLEREFQLCVAYRPHDWELICSMKLVNENKSRSDIYPVFTRQVALPAEPGVEGSNYINASYLQGYWRRDEFIVSQHPFEHTVTDFWKMVWDQNSSQVILLTGNAPNMEYPCFWPLNPDDTKEAGYLRVGFLHRREYQHSTHLKFLVSSTREDYSLVTNMWLYKQWPSSADGVMDLFHFIRQVQVERDKTGPFIVIDELGGSRAGIFCALNTLMDQLDNENCVDVYFVFKMYHRQRPGIFQCQADLEFVYDAIERYAKEPPPAAPLPPHSSNSSHHSSPGNGPTGGGGGEPNGGQLMATDSLTRGGRLTPNGVTLLGGDQTVSFYSNGGGTLPRLVVTAPNNGNATIDSRASRDASDSGDALT